MDELFRVCKKCKKKKPIEKFSIMWKRGKPQRWRRRSCIRCRNEVMKAYQSKWFKDRYKKRPPSFKWATATDEQKLARAKESFERSVIKNSEGCWGWKFKLSPNGYTKFRYGGSCTSGHRVSWMIHNGAIPPGMFVCHICDVKSCVNPEHLFIGTHNDNMRDMVKKGRGRNLAGEDNGNAILTVEKVKKIRRLLRSGVTAVRIAKDFKVCAASISNIKAGRTWKYVK